MPKSFLPRSFLSKDFLQQRHEWRLSWSTRQMPLLRAPLLKTPLLKTLLLLWMPLTQPNDVSVAGQAAMP